MPGSWTCVERVSERSADRDSMKCLHRLTLPFGGLRGYDAKAGRVDGTGFGRRVLVVLRERTRPEGDGDARAKQQVENHRDHRAGRAARVFGRIRVQGAATND